MRIGVRECAECQAEGMSARCPPAVRGVSAGVRSMYESHMSAVTGKARDVCPRMSAYSGGKYSSRSCVLDADHICFCVRGCPRCPRGFCLQRVVFNASYLASSFQVYKLFSVSLCVYARS